MKRLILIAALLITSSAQAEDYCIDLSGGARAVMHLRQTGIAARTQHDIADQTLFGIDAAVMHRIIDDAYTQPLETSKAAKEDAVQNFDVYWLLKCMKARNGFY